MDEQRNREMPDYYGTGRPPVERSKAPLIIALLGILLGTNLITAGFFLNLGSKQTNVEHNGESAQMQDPQLATQNLSGEELLSTVVTGLASVQVQTDGTAATGTGVILSEDGYILTNASLIENAQSLYATLSDGESYTASTVGLDADSDIAVIKIKAENLNPAPYAPSDNVAPGDSLNLFLSPFGAPDLTEIIVEDTQRLIGGMERRIFSVECGEGGVLVDETGLLVAFGTEDRGALPMSEAVALAGELIFYGSLDAPDSFGMEISQLDEALCCYWELPGGVVVSRVAKGGNADRAGLQAGDVILAIGDSPVTDIQSYWKALKENYQAEETFLHIYRAEEQLSLKINLSAEE